MTTLDLIIKNAVVLLAEDSAPTSKSSRKSDSKPNYLIREVQTHIGVKEGKIRYIGNDNVPAAQIIDGRGLHLLPGIIDSQVHMREPGMIHKEDLGSGTQAAALGGVTSVFEMPNTNPPTTTAELHADKMRRAREKAWVNYAFYVGASHENVDTLAELEKLPSCPGIKIFMGSSTGSLLVEDDPTLERIFRTGFRRLIFHAEDEDRLRERKQIAIDSKDVRNHPVWRDEETALRATQRLLKLCEKTGRPMHVLHITTAEEMDLLRKTKAQKSNPASKLISVEVLPQHLTLAAPECYERLGTLAQQNPPIRDQRHQDALWKAVLDGTVDILGSDHAPHTLEEKKREYPNSPGGMPGVQTIVPIMLNHVNQGKLPLSRLVELMCENPRHIFGCQSKGRIAIGLDADFTLVDMKKTRTIENKWIVSRCGWTPFDGMKTTGWPVATFVGGVPVMQDNHLVGTAKGQPVEFQF
ncbi:MAG: dihydroorotase [Pseudobdellovibrionaceae bacterium]